MSTKFPIPNSFTVTAHTGSMETPENSLESIEASIKAGADIVEIDLNFNSALVPVLSHNAPRGGEPTFEEALALIAKDDKVRLNIDVKSTADIPAVDKLVEQYGLKERVFFTGVFEKFVEAIKQGSDIEYYLNYSPSKLRRFSPLYCSQVAKKIKQLGAVGLNTRFSNSSKALVHALHRDGLLISCWTANTKPQMEKLLQLGVDNITTRHPDVLIEMIEK